MKYIITESQYNTILEYFDPIYYLKNKFKGEPRYRETPDFLKYEEKFQKLVDFVFKRVKKNIDLKHLKGFKVTEIKLEILDGNVKKSRPAVVRWMVSLTPIVDDYFNWRKNDDFKEKLKKIIKEFHSISKYLSSPYDLEGYNRDEVGFSFYAF